MKIETYLPIFPGFYGSIFEFDREEDEIDHFSLETGRELTYEDIEWDYDEFHQRVSEACVDAIEAELKSEGFDITINFQKLVSPKYYNFSNDSIDIELELSTEVFDSLIEYLKANLDEFEEYLTRYKSYDGFMSSYSYDSADWFNEYLTKDSTSLDHCIGSVLEFILSQLEYDQHSLYDDVVDEYYIGAEVKDNL